MAVFPPVGRLVGQLVGAHLQVVVVVLTQQLQEPQDGLHDGDGRAHLRRLHLALLRRRQGRQGRGPRHRSDGGGRGQEVT